jgi:hypothetical protein
MKVRISEITQPTKKYLKLKLFYITNAATLKAKVAMHMVG